MTDISQKIAEWLPSQLKDTDVFIVDIQYLAKRDKIQVFLDADSLLDIETCVQISRYLENLLEQDKLVSPNYTLEVSSPGVGNPFKVFRQYQKAIGKTLEITLQDGSIKEGTLQTLTETNIEIIPIPEKSNKKIKIVPPPITIPFEQIKHTKEKIVF